jgi:beta-lactam-binding protein with PASTA domain
MVVQTGVWAITDRYSGTDVKQRLIAVDQYGNIQHVSDMNVKEAKRILKDLNIKNNL